MMDSEKNLAELLKMEQKVFAGSNGENLNYCRREMGNRKAGEKIPVVIFLHGAGERGDNNWSQLFHGARELTAYCEDKKLNVLLLFPQCPFDKQWVDTPWGDLKHSLPEISRPLFAAMEMLDFEIKNSNIDTDRVYISGISMGGYGTWDALSRFPEKFAAAFPICGGADLAQADKLKDIPILTYHGEKDDIVWTQRSRDIVSAIKAAGGEKITYVEVPECGHNSWETAFAKSENWDWLFSNSK